MDVTVEDSDEPEFVITPQVSVKVLMVWLAIQNFYRFVKSISQVMFNFLYVAFKHRIQHGMLKTVRDFRVTLLLSRGRRHSHLCYKRFDLE